MPAPIISQDEAVDRLAAVFRGCGYEGASLARLSAATGLGKASLYHHFPGGKAEMAARVLDRVGAAIEDTILKPLGGPGAPAARIGAFARGLAALYEGGHGRCLIEILSQGEAAGLFGPRVAKAVRRWIAAIAAVLVEAGIAPDAARRRAEQAMVEIQGALVLSRALGNTGPFKRMLERLPAMLLAR